MTLNLDVISAVAPGAKRTSGEVSEDAVAVARVESIVLIALADGAGSAPRGGYGAQLAVSSAVESLQESLAGNSPSPLDAALRTAIDAARLTLSIAKTAADSEAKSEVADLATTLSLAAFGPDEIGVASVGDGLHILRDLDGELSFIAVATDTEIANHTDFITAPTLDGKVEIEVRPAAEVESLLLSSDGLDSQLVGRRDGKRWPLAATVNSLLNAPVLDGWTGPDFGRLLRSEVIRRHSDDDCSLALVRRPLTRRPDSTEVAGLTLTLSGERARRRTWRVAGCASLLTIELSPSVPPDAAIAARSEQVWDRTCRYPPVYWPIRRIGENLVLVPRTPPRARDVRGTLRRAVRQQRLTIVTGLRSCVEAVHAAGVSHGELALECFAVHPDGTVGLWNPGPGMFEGSNRELCSERDLAFVAKLEREQGRTRLPAGHRRGGRQGARGRRGRS